MTPTTAYVEPTGAQIIPYFNPAQPLKTNDDIMRKWLHGGYTFGHQTVCVVPRRSVQARGTRLFWYDKVIAEHFEYQTVIYEQRDKAAANLSRSLRKLMVTEANWQPIDLTKQDNMDAVLATVVGSTYEEPNGRVHKAKYAAKETENLHATLDVIFGDS